MVLFRRHITPRRLRYAWWMGMALWGAWLFSLVLGPGYLDLAGQPIGTDYLQFYAAGMTVREGASARLYDTTYQAELEQEIIGPGLTTYHAFITPPFLAWLFVPLSLLPYEVSYTVWSLVGLVCLVTSLSLLHRDGRWRNALWALTWFPVFASISFGQNALMTLVLFCLTYRLWTADRPVAAGLVASLALYKPQLLLGISVIWLLDLRRSWRALLGLAIAGTTLALLSFTLLPEASWAYVDFAGSVLPDLPNWEEFPIWHLHTVRGFWRLLLPWWPGVGDLLTAAAAVLGLAAAVRLRHTMRSYRRLAFGVAVVLGLWLTPHAMIYDLTLLLIPAMILWYELPGWRDRWRPFYALVWLATLISGPLTHFQLLWLPAAGQVSIPVLTMAYREAYGRLRALSVAERPS